jgi:uncharacterized membrane protein YfcA
MTSINLHELSLVAFVAISATLFVAGSTKGLIGVGMPIVAVPLLTLVVDLRVVVSLLSIPLIITNIPQALRGDCLSVVLRRLAPIFAGLIVGVLIGVNILTSVDPVMLKPIVGIVLILIALVTLLSPRFSVPRRVEPIASPAVGLLGGILGGVAAQPGPLVFTYLLSLGITRDQFVQYSSAFLTVAASVMTITLGGKGVLGWSDALVSTVSALPIFVGMWVGSHIRQFVSAELFRKLVLGVVVLSGVHLIVN